MAISIEKEAKIFSEIVLVVSNLSQTPKDVALNQLNQGTLKHLAALALLLVPGPALGTELYQQVARLSWNIAYEAVFFVVDPITKKICVFLRKRADNDPEAPGEWHCPGSAYRPGETQQDVEKRLVKEFGGDIKGNLVSSWMNPKRPGEKVGDSRGSFEHKIMLVSGDFSVDNIHRFFFIDQLPEETIWYHRDIIIPCALMHYKMLNRIY